MALDEVGGLAAVGEPDPETQVVVGELTGRIDPSPNMLKTPKLLCSPGISFRSRRCRVQPNPVGYARMPVSPIARCGVRARISSTGTIPGTTSTGGSTQACRR
jgi:hypothetical protein